MVCSAFSQTLLRTNSVTLFRVAAAARWIMAAWAVVVRSPYLPERMADARLREGFAFAVIVVVAIMTSDMGDRF